jgi:hypothetical protein
VNPLNGPDLASAAAEVLTDLLIRSGCTPERPIRDLTLPRSRHAGFALTLADGRQLLVDVKP